MCGICGIALSERSERSIDRDLLIRARDTLTHRGPDDSGLYVGARVGLGHRRLSIVDVAGGHQPISSDDGALHLVYNGETYNHLEIRKGLEGAGHRYHTQCDTETVLRLYQERGADGVQALRGMFAFAIWDERDGRLFLARDRIGIKPLYYAILEDGSLCFGSEIKAVLALMGGRPRLNSAALPDYLANHAPSGPDTLFEGVRRLLPGHTLTWRSGEVRVAAYWDPGFPPESDPVDVGTDPVGEFRERLTESVRLRLMADVPLGVFLSGGIDSAAITGLMAPMVDEPIQSFSVAFEDRSANELVYARQVAEAFETRHHEIVVSPAQSSTRSPDCCGTRMSPSPTPRAFRSTSWPTWRRATSRSSLQARGATSSSAAMAATRAHWRISGSARSIAAPHRLPSGAWRRGRSAHCP